MQVLPVIGSSAASVSTSAPLTLASSGRLDVKLADSEVEIRAAQALRYHVFYEEMHATPSAEMARLGRDFDVFDDYCDHLLVIDRDLPKDRCVVGTYRLMRQEEALAHGGFYSATEFDIAPLIARMAEGERFLELGRSCVHPAYRSNKTIQLLWQAIHSYIQVHQITYMFGCGSFPGTDLDALALPLSFLHHEYLAPESLRVRAHADRYVSMNRMPREAISIRQALRKTPPLIKGYLRLGAYVGDGAVIDEPFGTTDCFILVPVERIANRYNSHFDRLFGERDATG